MRDSLLVEAIYAYLKEQNAPVAASELGKKILKIANLPDDVADKMVDVLLGEDRRFRKLEDNQWTLRLEPPPEGELKRLHYCILDVEITGHARSPRIIEIAAVRLENMAPSGEFHRFVNPGRAIYPKVLNHTIVDTEMLRTAPKIEEIFPEFFQFIGNRILVAHNAHFDLRMLNRELRRISHMKLANPVIDTLKVSRRCLPGVDTQRLPELARYFGVALEEHHLARDDARALAHIFPKLVDLLAEEGITHLSQMKEFMIGAPPATAGHC